MLTGRRRGDLGRHVMVKTLPVPRLPPPATLSMTVTGRCLPAFAPVATFAVAVILVELTTLTLLKVTPVGPESVAPLKKPVPVIVTDSDVPGFSDDGVIAFTVGAATATMVKTLPVPRPWPPATPLMTVTVRPLPAFALAATLTVAVILVGLTTLTLLKVTPVGPVSVAPLKKPLPVTVTDSDAPGFSDDGVIDFTVGAATIVRHVMHEPDPDESATATVAAPTFAETTFALAVMVVELTAFTDEKLIPETLTVAPVTNPVPVRMTPTFDAPRPSRFGEN